MSAAPSLTARAIMLLLIVGTAALVARQVVVARHVQGRYWTPWRIVGWAIVTLLALSARLPLFMSLLMPPQTVLVDFFQEWASVQNWRHGLDIYEDLGLAAARYLKLDVDMREQYAVEVNAHPPAAVLVAMPVALLGNYSLAVLAWNLLSLVLGAAALAIIDRELRLAQCWPALLALVPLALFFDPLLLQVHFAQLNLLLLFLVVGAWAAARRRQDALAGAFLGTAAAVKLYPSLLILYFALQRRWRLAAAALLAALAWLAATLLVFGVEAHLDYVFKVLPRVQEWRSGWGNLSLLGWWARLFDPGTKGGPVIPLLSAPTLARAGAFASVAILIVAASWIAWRARTLRQRELSLALFIVTMLLASPTSWEHYFILLILPAAIFWTVGDGRLVALGLVVLLLPIWLPPAAMFYLWGGMGPKALPIHSLLLFPLKTYAILAFWSLLAWAAAGKVNEPEPTT